MQTGLSSQEPHLLQLGASHLYWASFNAGIFRAPLGGGTPEVLMAQSTGPDRISIRHMVVDVWDPTETVYFSSHIELGRYGVYRLRPGQPAMLWASAEGAGESLGVGSHEIYWNGPRGLSGINRQVAGFRNISAASPMTGPILVLGGQPSRRYWASDICSTDACRYVIHRDDGETQEPAYVVSQPGWYAHLVMNHDSIFWSVLHSGLYRVSADAPTFTTPVELLQDTVTVQPLHADAMHVYWQHRTSSGSVTIQRIPVLGGAPEVFARPVHSTYRLGAAGTANALYILEGDGVIRRYAK